MCQKKVYQSAKEARVALDNLKRHKRRNYYVGSIKVYHCPNHLGYHFGHAPKENPYPYELAQRAFAKAKQGIEPIVRKRPFRDQK